ncbi:fimbria/pilus chaperone family protein [Kluyvera sichuanensis]|uniref:fimbria/pilus chaperone family protein n=1 Tax=Kluyvera sichuanensis TaxID=2725494 RepID=UPI0039F54011
MIFKKKCLIKFVILSTIIKLSTAMANGMVPDTSLLIINESDKSSSIDVTNTDTTPDLLYTNIVDLPDDKGTRLVATDPVVRVEPGQKQLVRFILQTDEPLTVEHMKRVTFEGIPPKHDNSHEVSINIRQDIPVLIHPASLPVVKDAWKLLNWTRNGNKITVNNPSSYVVRLSEEAFLLPSTTKFDLGKTYILPGQSITIDVKKNTSNESHVKFSPASRYGVQVDNYTAILK